MCLTETCARLCHNMKVFGAFVFNWNCSVLDNIISSLFSFERNQKLMKERWNILKNQTCTKWLKQMINKGHKPNLQLYCHWISSLPASINFSLLSRMESVDLPVEKSFATVHITQSFTVIKHASFLCNAESIELQTFPSSASYTVPEAMLRSWLYQP